MTKDNINRYQLIDFLKGLLVIFVVLTHCNWSESQRLHMLFPYWIDMAVPSFMIISGFVYSQSYMHNKISTIKMAYDYKKIIKKIIRYTIPYIMAFVIEVIVYIMKGNVTFSNLVVYLFTGGIGPGSYYYPIMIQFIFVFPFIYFIIKKYDFFGLILTGAINFGYEFLKQIYGMPTEEYRLLIFRYILLISIGCYFAIGRKKIKNEHKTIVFVFGCFWLFIIYYLKYKTHIINFDWAGTSMFSALYVAPIFSVLLRKNLTIKKQKTIFEIIGKSSYNIYLTQMVWYGCNSQGFLTQYVNNYNFIIILNVLVCVTLGVVFFKIESILTKKIINKLNKENYYKTKILRLIYIINK